MKKKKSIFNSNNPFLAIFIVVVVVVVLHRLFGPWLFFKALAKKSYTEKQGYSETISCSFQDSGCHAIGIVSTSKKMDNYITKGQYKIDFLDSSGSLIDSVNIEKNRTTSAGRSLSELNMYIFEIPYKHKYWDLKIRYTIIKPDPVLQSVKDLIVLYVRKSMPVFKCGEELEKEENMKKFGIKTYTESDPRFAPLFSAIKNKDFKTIKILFSNRKLSPDVKMPGERQPIHYAAYYNDVKTLKYLIDHKVDLNPADIAGFTPIQYAISANNPEAISVLLENGISIKSIDRVPNILSSYKDIYQPYNPLFYSVNICSCELTKTMVDHGIDINQYDNFETYEKITILDYLSLRKCREKIDAVDTDDSQKKYKKMETLLISYGAKRSPPGLKPIYIGEKRKR